MGLWPQGCFGHQLLASELAVVDDRYRRDTVIVADMSNDASYAEPLVEVFGKRVVGVQIGTAGDGTTFERRVVKNGVIFVYRLGRTFLFDLLLQKFRSGQIRLAEGPMARRAFEQLNSLELEQTENRVRYICLPGQHDDLAISLAMLVWYRPRPRRPQGNPWKAFV